MFLNPKKQLFFLIIILFFTSPNRALSQHVHNVELKANLATALLLMPNFGVEMQVAKQTSVQVDLFGAFWKSVDSNPYMRGQLMVDYRYYPWSYSLNKLYFGPHIGGGVYKVNNRFSYPEGVYQKGANFDVGMTVGYKHKIRYNMSLEFFIGAGWSHSRFNNYIQGRDEPLDSEGRGYDLSSKWRPQRFGIMLTYSLNAIRKWND